MAQFYAESRRRDIFVVAVSGYTNNKKAGHYCYENTNFRYRWKTFIQFYDFFDALFGPMVIKFVSLGYEM